MVFLILLLHHFFLSFQVKAKGTLMKMVTADWLRSDKREDDLGGHYGSIVLARSSPMSKFTSNLVLQKYAARIWC